MKSIIHLKTITPPVIIITVALLCLVAAGPRVQAVSPPPDGGYPGGNTAEGQNALLSRTTGGFNTAVGYLSLRSNTTNSFNTTVGAGTLLANTADNNTATGAGALLSNSTGGYNTANGAFALFSNTDGGENTANGYNALGNNASGNNNTANGYYALASNTAGGANAAVGFWSLRHNTMGDFNTAMGNETLIKNTSGSHNTALGFGAGGNVTTASNVICIGADGNDVSDSCFIGNIFGATSSGGIAVLVNSNGRLGTMTSSRRFKEDVRPMDKASEAILALKPVTFHYKKEIDPARTSQFGLVAEDVEKVNADLVVRDKEGKAYSVRYDQVNAMLLNEFLKEHRKVEQQDRRLGGQEATIGELKSTIAQQQKAMEAMTAQLREQGAQIQKVSAQIEVSKAAPKVACLPAVALREGGNNP